MKYLILVLDGVADKPVATLNNKTPLEVACTPNIDKLAQRGVLGKVQTIPKGFSPGSDIGNLALLGYEEKWMNTGRGFFEALGMGVRVPEGFSAFRLNFVGLDKIDKVDEVEEKDNQEKEGLEEKSLDKKCLYEIHSAENLYEYKLKSYGVEDISPYESQLLLRDLALAYDDLTREKQNLHDESKEDEEISSFAFHIGKGFKHLGILKGNFSSNILEAPNTFVGETLGENIPSHLGFEKLRDLVLLSTKVFKNHPVNLKRIKEAKPTIDGIWLWGQGSFLGEESLFCRTKKKAIMISGVSIVRGIGMWSGMETPKIQGATGDENTDYSAKVQRAIEAFERGLDLAYIHIEATDELAHRGDAKGKVKAIEDVDKKILGEILSYFEKRKEEYSILIATDHYTLCESGMHSSDPVPFLLYRGRLIEGEKLKNPEEEALYKEQTCEDQICGDELHQAGICEDEFSKEKEDFEYRYFDEKIDNKIFFESGKKLFEYFLA